MKLIPLPSDSLHDHPTLPFPVFAQDGRLLLPAHTPLRDPRVSAKLRGHGSLYAQDCDIKAWHRGVAQVVDAVVQRNALLLQLAKARPNLVRPKIPAIPGEDWEELVMALDKTLQSPVRNGRWLVRVLELQASARSLAVRRIDEALFHFVYIGGCRTSHYSSRQALRCMFIAGEAARELQWDDARIELLDKAALTMNVASWQLQDRLARHAGPIAEPEDKTQIEHHPAEGARWLEECGVTDPAWLEAVRLHHDDSLANRPFSQLTPGQQTALLLRRVDRYGAMLSRRAGREPLSSTQAAQHACLGMDGRPDPIGSLMLKAIGLYPPGSFVALANHERGIVLARGARANQPMVAALVNADGVAMVEPRLRDASLAMYAVRAALRPSEVLVDLSLEKLRALRSCFK